MERIISSQSPLWRASCIGTQLDRPAAKAEEGTEACSGPHSKSISTSWVGLKRSAQRVNYSKHSKAGRHNRGWESLPQAYETILSLLVSSGVGVSGPAVTTVPSGLGGRGFGRAGAEGAISEAMLPSCGCMWNCSQQVLMAEIETPRRKRQVAQSGAWWKPQQETPIQGLRAAQAKEIVVLYLPSAPCSKASVSGSTEKEGLAMLAQKQFLLIVKLICDQSVGMKPASQCLGVFSGPDCSHSCPSPQLTLLEKQQMT